VAGSRRGVNQGHRAQGTGQGTGVDPRIRGPDLLRGARCNHDGVLGRLGRWLRINWRWRRSSMVVSSLQEPVRRAGQRQNADEIIRGPFLAAGRICGWT
jgi:hypothetical protein